MSLLPGHRFTAAEACRGAAIDLNTLIVDFQQILRRVIGEHIELHTRAAAENGMPQVS